jgi:hypothetical protein
MAQNDLDTGPGFVDKRRATRAGSATNSIATDANFADIGAMRTRLTAISATAYSAANLDKMTRNDMVHALRLADEAASV